jgi:hypothetical protein
VMAQAASRDASAVPLPMYSSKCSSTDRLNRTVRHAAGQLDMLTAIHAINCQVFMLA